MIKLLKEQAKSRNEMMTTMRISLTAAPAIYNASLTPRTTKKYKASNHNVHPLSYWSFKYKELGL